MKKVRIYLMISIITGLFFISCKNEVNQNNDMIYGQITERSENGDSVYLSNGNIAKAYYEEVKLKGNIENQKFNISNNLSYPHLYRVNFHSEINRIPQRAGFYFLDTETKTITIDSIGECSRIAGPTQLEFQQEFIPFLIPDYQCDQFELSNLYYDNSSKFDQKLIEYIRQKPDSFVALWFLVDRINEEGYSKPLAQILEKFSPSIKNERIWKIAKNQINTFQIRKDEKFPILTLKNPQLSQDTLKLGRRLTLVDFWFYSCRPCLRKFKVLEEIYPKYRADGFEIVAISTDKTEAIGKWQHTLKSKNYPWQNYLDQDAVIASREKITFFPTSFLLDDKGWVITKNPSLEEITQYLEAETD